MWSLALPLLFTLLAWWGSTAAILQLVKLPRRTHPLVMALGTLALPLGLYAVAAPGDGSAPGAGAAYLGFCAALLVWGWQELAFLLGYVTGPHREPCPEGVTEAQRVRLAVRAVLHHELALVLLGTLIAVLTPAGGSPMALWTFAALWVLRLSAKLNLFLGSRNPQAHLLPPHLAYMGSYFRRRPMNPLFPWSMALSLLAAAALAGAALAAGVGEHDRTALLLLAALVALGALEHALMMLPAREHVAAAALAAPLPQRPVERP